ncbi:MAG TPA: APC family permease [Gemmataceae bacterium]|nr:APC family permease [Gemmataceae bacterium]
MSEPSQPEGGGHAHGQLSLWDTVSIIVGIVIGSSIFTIPTIIFIRTAGPWEALGMWLLGGVFSFIGALCYAELATAYPRYGGDYVYITRGLDRPLGFLFGWSQLAVILTASTGAMAFIFGDYGTRLFDVNANPQQAVLSKAEESLKQKKEETASLGEKERDAALSSVVAQKKQAESELQNRQKEIGLFAAQLGVGAVIVLTLLNFFGVVLGKWLQNVLVLIKLSGLLLIVLAAIIVPVDNAFTVNEGTTRGQSGIPGAMILVLYAFGGWNDAAFVAADLKDRRNITKALLFSTLGITAIYLLVNFAYIWSIGYEPGRRFNFAMPAEIMTKAFTKIGGEDAGPIGGKIISAIIMISALGAMNGLIYTGSRVYLPLGKEHRVFGFLGYWNKTLKSPMLALIAQALVSISMILIVGTEQGRDGVDHVLTTVGIPAIPWAEHFGGFNTLFDGSAPVFWIFFLLTGISMFALRARDPKIERPFMLKPPFYPTLPIIFCGMCLFGFWSAMTTAGWVCLLGFIPLSIGLPLYWISGKGHEPAESVEVATGVVDQVEDQKIPHAMENDENPPPADSFREKQ